MMIEAIFQKFLTLRSIEMGIEDAFVQDNHSFSKKPGTLRGFHFQSPPHAQSN